MIKHIIKRLLQAIPIVLGVVTVTFIIIHLAPGDPFEMFFDQSRIANQRNVSPELRDLLMQKYGLDQPLYIQYFKWLENLVKGDLGESFRYRVPVTTLIAERIPFTLQITALALIFDALVGIAIGIIAAVKQYSILDKVVTLGSLVIHSIPGFWLALMLVLFFAVNLGWLPTSQTRSMDYEFFSWQEKFFDRIWHLILPVFVLGVASAAGTARYMRNSLLEVLSAEYILAARARGLKERVVILKHALRNALIPIITIFGMKLPFLLSGAVLIENVFGWPGMGTLATGAAGARDYPVMLATSLIAAFLVIMGNLIADITYAIVDPRVSYDK